MHTYMCIYICMYIYIHILLCYISTTHLCSCSSVTSVTSVLRGCGAEAVALQPVTELLGNRQLARVPPPPLPARGTERGGRIP